MRLVLAVLWNDLEGSWGRVSLLTNLGCHVTFNISPNRRDSAVTSSAGQQARHLLGTPYKGK